MLNIARLKESSPWVRIIATDASRSAASGSRPWNSWNARPACAAGSSPRSRSSRAASSSACCTVKPLLNRFSACKGVFERLRLGVTEPPSGQSKEPNTLSVVWRIRN